jgi:hypothetical protein
MIVRRNVLWKGYKKVFFSKAVGDILMLEMRTPEKP